MLNLINKNKFVKYFVCFLSLIFFIVVIMPILSIIIEILYSAGSIIGTMIRTYSIC